MGKTFQYRDNPKHDSFRILVLKKSFLIGCVEVNPGPKRGYKEISGFFEPHDSETCSASSNQEQRENQTSLQKEVNDMKKALEDKGKQIDDLRAEQLQLKIELERVKQVLKRRVMNEDCVNENVDLVGDCLRPCVTTFPVIPGLADMATQACSTNDWRACAFLLEENLKKHSLVHLELQLCYTVCRNSSILVAAIRNDCIELVGLFLKNGFPVNTSIGSLDRNMLHYAAVEGNLNMIKYLLSSDANINMADSLQLTPLHLAVENNRVDAVALLVDHGANTGLKNLLCETPLDMAMKNESASIINILKQDSDCDVASPVDS